MLDSTLDRIANYLPLQRPYAFQLDDKMLVIGSIVTARVFPTVSQKSHVEGAVLLPPSTVGCRWRALSAGPTKPEQVRVRLGIVCN